MSVRFSATSGSPTQPRPTLHGAPDGNSHSSLTCAICFTFILTLTNLKGNMFGIVGTVCLFVTTNYVINPIFYIIHIFKFFLLVPWVPVGYILEIDSINPYKLLEFLNLMIQYLIVNIFISAVIARLLFNNLSLVYYAGNYPGTNGSKVVDDLYLSEDDTSTTWDRKWMSYRPDDTNITIPDLVPRK